MSWKAIGCLAVLACIAVPLIICTAIIQTPTSPEPPEIGRKAARDARNYPTLYDHAFVSVDMDRVAEPGEHWVSKDPSRPLPPSRLWADGRGYNVSACTRMNIVDNHVDRIILTDDFFNFTIEGYWEKIVHSDADSCKEESEKVLFDMNTRRWIEGYSPECDGKGRCRVKLK